MQKVPNKLRCNLCEEQFDMTDDDQAEDYDNIEQTGRCIDCYQEWGDEWPDRI